MTIAPDQNEKLRPGNNILLVYGHNIPPKQPQKLNLESLEKIMMEALFGNIWCFMIQPSKMSFFGVFFSVIKGFHRTACISVGV